MKNTLRRTTLLAAVFALPLASAATAQSGKSLQKCEATVSKETTKYIRSVSDTLGKCLQAASTEVLAKGGSAGNAASSCVKTLAKLVNTAKPTKTHAGRFNAKVAKACDPSVNTKLKHAEAEVYTVGSGNISAGNIGAYCASFGGSGTIGDFDQWRDCVRAAADCEVYQSVATQYPRALEYAEALITAIGALPATQATTDALTALGTADTEIEGATDDNIPEIACGPSTQGAASSLPQTGQVTCTDRTQSINCAGTGQDGDLGHGTPLSYTDNGVTTTDNATGLTWENICFDSPPYANCPEIHNLDTVYSWDAAYGKISSMNAASYGGFNDWRLPNRREWMSIAYYQSTDPSHHPTFAVTCVSLCDEGTCNCASVDYWTSTSAPSDPNNAFFVDTRGFHIGYQRKTDSKHVRAVRGP